MLIKKRNKKKVEFDTSKIKNALSKANLSVDEEERLSDTQIQVVEEEVQKSLSKLSYTPTVEDIQDLVVEQIQKAGKYKLAASYITYRTNKSTQRGMSQLEEEVLALRNGDNAEAIEENANKNPLLVSTMRDYQAGILNRELAKKIVPQEVMQAHELGLIHFHDSDYTIAPIYNCFSEDTKFITKNGMYSFRDFSENDIIEVLSLDGEYHKAKVKRYGKQPLYKYTFHSGKKEFTHDVIATENHRWILQDGTETTSLSVGDKLCKPPVIYHQELDWESLTYEEKLMWCKGFALGDGTIEYKSNRSRIRLCGDKDLQYLERFKIEGCTIRNAICENGDRNVVVFNYTKTIPEFASIKELQCFINGLYCADGRKKQMKSGKYNFGIQSSSLEVINFLRKMSGTAGLYITRENERTGEVTNFTTNEGRPYTILFSFNSDFEFHYTVSNKEFVGEENVWCLEVEDTHNFILEYGIPTGNCELLNLDDMLQNGTVISGVKIDKPHSLLTAVTIATQISAQVSGGTFGGQSMSLAHLAPFVDVSRTNIRKRYESLGIEGELLDTLVSDAVEKEIKSAVQTYNYQLSTLQNING